MTLAEILFYLGQSFNTFVYLTLASRMLCSQSTLGLYRWMLPFFALYLAAILLLGIAYHNTVIIIALLLNLITCGYSLDVYWRMRRIERARES